MISIIICSCNTVELAAVEKNIRETIGVPYEIISLDNRENRYTIFSAYNIGIERAKGDIVCFIHEDVIFHTNDWGGYLKRHLLNEEIGIVGVFGAHFMPKCFPVTYWYNPCSGTVLQGTRNKTNVYTVDLLSRYESPQGIKNEVEVAVVDGLWMAGKKDLFRKIQFDDRTYSGFHCYDIDISMQSLKLGKKNIVVNDILIEHKSFGHAHKKFYSALRLWYKKWNDDLPIYRGINIDEMPWKDISLRGYFFRKLGIKYHRWTDYFMLFHLKRCKALCKVINIIRS